MPLRCASTTFVRAAVVLGDNGGTNCWLLSFSMRQFQVLALAHNSFDKEMSIKVRYQHEASEDDSRGIHVE
jgi:hypothetical protein